MKITKLLIATIVAIVFTCSCQKKFADYPSLIDYVQKTFKAETLNPNSSSITKAQYFSNSKQKYLIIDFSSGQKRIYQNFSAEDWKNFMSAQSKGNYYNQNIKDAEEYKVNLAKKE